MCVWVGWGGARVSDFFTKNLNKKNPNLKYIYFGLRLGARSGGGGTRVSEFFYYEFKSEIIFSGGEGGGEGGRG